MLYTKKKINTEIGGYVIDEKSKGGNKRIFEIRKVIEGLDGREEKRIGLFTAARINAYLTMCAYSSFETWGELAVTYFRFKSTDIKNSIYKLIRMLDVSYGTREPSFKTEDLENVE